MKLHNVTIRGRTGELAGLHYVPDGNLRDVALVLAHGFTSGKYTMDGLAGYLAARGYEALTFDFIGHKMGGSGGTMETIAQAPGNLADAIAWLRERTAAKRIVLVGHSLGAAAALATAAWEMTELATPALIGKFAKREPAYPPLAGVVGLCMGTEPAAGFESRIGQAMLEQRRDYVAGAPAIELLREVDGLLNAVTGLGALPALFVAARQDVLISVERVQRLAQSVSNSTVLEIDSSHLEAPDKSKAAVYSWLSQL